jgi:hypothetical protein
MPDSNLTHIHFLLDRSGSMQSIKPDTEAGFEAFIAEQRGIPGECRVSLVQFNHEYEEIYLDRPLAQVTPLRLEPSGNTAMLDAIGTLITRAGSRLAQLPEARRPGTVVVAIMTDGLENASKVWTRPQIKALIEQQANVYSWKFLYMGADQDAIEVGKGIGVDAGHAVTYSRGRAREVVADAGARVRATRAARACDPNAAMPSYTDEDRKALGEGSPKPRSPR